VKLTLKHKAAIGFGLGLVILIAISIASYRLIADFSASADFRKQSSEVIANIEHISSLLNDIQADQRGYVIIGQEDLLRLYPSKVKMINQEIKTIKELTLKEPDQQKRLETLKPLIAQITEFGRQVIDIRKKQGRAAAENLVMTGRGEQLMKDIEEIINDIIKKETLLLKERDQSLRTIARSTTYIVVSGTLLAILIVIISVVVIWREITQRTRAEEERNRLFNFSIDMMCIAGFDGYFKQLNPAWGKTLGWTQKELMSKPYLEFVHPEDRESTIDSAKKLQEGTSVLRFENRYQCKDGSYKWISWNCYPLLQEQLIFAVARNITERKRMTEELQKSRDDLEFEVQVRTAELVRTIEDLHRTNRALKTLSGCNQVLVHATEEKELLNGMCTVLVETGGYRLAWIGYAGQDDAKSVTPVTHAGYDEGYLVALNVTWADEERGRGPTGTAIRTGKPVIVTDILSDTHYAFLREEATRRRYASSISLPLISDTQTFGALNIYASSPNAFSEEEVTLLTELSNDLAYGIMALRTKAERRVAVKTFKEEKAFTEDALNTLKDVFFVFDPAGNFLRWNKAMSTASGFSDKEISSMKVFDFFLEEDIKRVTEAVETVYKEGVGSIEAAVVTKDRRQIPYDFTASLLMNHEGKIIGICGVGRDITERKQAEETIKELSHRNELILNSAGEGIVGFDRNGIHTFVNPAAAKMLGYDADELVGRSGHAVWHHTKANGSPHPENECPISRTYKYGTAQGPTEDIFWRKDGKSFPVEYSSTPIKEGDKLVGAVLIFRNITELKEKEAQLRQRLDHIIALRNIDQAITASLDLRVTLNVFLEQVVSQLHVDAASVLLLNSETMTLEYKSGRGFRTDALKHTRLRLGNGHASRAVLERRIIYIADLLNMENGLGRSPRIAEEGFTAYYAAPITAKGKITGVLEIFHRSPLEPEQEWLDFLDALATQASIAIDNAEMFNNLQRSNIDLILAYDATIEGWSRALDYRDRETEGHSRRVTEMAVKIAQAMGMSDAELVNVRRGALLHDIGKMKIPDSILLKPGKLTDDEWEIMHEHPEFAYELLSPIAFLRPALDIPYCHHEKWDGTGYPRGLKGEQIPLAARIFALIDVWDALSSDRPYRPAWPKEKVMEYLSENAGTHFDPQVVKVFLETDWHFLNES
jgi:PAS domain S-box-containing protein/putative nucleotidyltransferase with HDIG domain